MIFSSDPKHTVKVQECVPDQVFSLVFEYFKVDGRVTNPLQEGEAEKNL